ncbi:hypothetical protein BC629DRAFT_1724895 [Irpex lacteus]|nr:hypothetical protein BC629DRAFT_1724895 [Irpex lacteus]
MEEDADENVRFLPSPEKSPKKKGMSAEGVKYARDLFVVRGVYLPAIYGIFEDSHLSDLLTATLAIPLAPSLPTPNARKTYALSIWLLQFQRLPERFLPAKDRIAYAYTRYRRRVGLAPTLFSGLRPACPGGYAYGLSTLPTSRYTLVQQLHRSLPYKGPLGTPSKKPTSPTKDPAIIRTLRTTLGATDPKHVAQGPVWALSLLAYFIIMLGPQVYLDERMSKCITALSALATRHPRSTIRSLACLVWRCMTWAYFRPLPVKLAFEDDEMLGASQETGWRVLSSVIEMGAAASTISALLSVPISPSDRDRPLRWALSLLSDLSKRGGFCCQEALFGVMQLLSRFDPRQSEQEEFGEYEWSKLLPLGLFSSNPGLLTVDYSQLPPVVKGLLKEYLGEALRGVKIAWGDSFPSEIMDVWTCLLNAKVRAAEDDESQLAEFASYVGDLLISIVEENGLDLSSKQEDDDRLLLVRQLWIIVVNTLPASHLSATAEAVFASIVKAEVNLVGADMDVADEVRDQWASLCAEVAYYCEEQEVLVFWGLKRGRRSPHHQRGKKWNDVGGNTWDMADESLDEWKAFLQYTADRALDYGVDAISVVDQIASVLTGQTLSAASSTHVSDLLLSCLDMSDARSLPTSLFELANETLLNVYPPTIHTKTSSFWLLRTVMRCIDTCPVEIADHVLETLQDGLSQWILDEKCGLTLDEYSLDVLPIYETVLARMMVLSLQPSALTNLAQLIESGLAGRSDKPEAAVAAFVDFWKFSYANKSEPEGGWPERIVRCLEISGLRMVEDAPDADDKEVESQLFLESESDEVPLSPVIPSPDSLAEAFVLFREDATPPRAKIRKPPPFLPHDVPGNHHRLSPGTSSVLRSLRKASRLPRRSPTTPKRRTPGSARARAEKYEKENMSPLRKIASVAERIASQSPIASILGKRRADDIDEDLPGLGETHKRVHRDVTHIFGDSLRNSPVLHVNMARIPDVPETPTKPRSSPSMKVPLVDDSAPVDKPEKPVERAVIKLRKQKGVFLESVEVPPLHEVLKRRSASLDIPAPIPSSSKSLAQAKSMPVGGGALRRTRSNTKLDGEGSETQQLGVVRRRRPAPPRPAQPYVGKRKRIDVLTEEDVFSVSSSLASPLQRLKEMDTMGSDDSITLATPDLTVATSSMASSDDDPHRYLGQVTPHRLVSPAIRRVLDDDPFAEPGSDDSNMSNSPSSERVARMKSRKPLAAMTPLRQPFRLAHSSKI